MKKGDSINRFLDIALSGVLIVGIMIAGCICVFAYCIGKVFSKR